MITTKVDTWEKSCISLVDARLEALMCQDEVYLVVNLPLGACQVAVLDNFQCGECWQG